MNGSGAIVLPLGLLSVLVVAMANLAVSYSNGIADRVRSETMQDSAIGALQAEIELLRQDVQHLERVELKLLKTHQIEIEIALKKAQFME